MMKIIDKFLLFIYSTAVVIFSGYVIYLTAVFQNFTDAAASYERLIGFQWPGYVFGLVAALLILISMRFIYISLRRGKGGAPSIDQRNEFGEVSISIDTVENLALNAASRIRGVKDLKTRVHVSNAGLDISIRALVDGEIAIPGLSEECNAMLKSILKI